MSAMSRIDVTHVVGTSGAPATWNGVGARLERFLVTPLYRWFNTGEFAREQNIGMLQSRRSRSSNQSVTS